MKQIIFSTVIIYFVITFGDSSPHSKEHRHASISNKSCLPTHKPKPPQPPQTPHPPHLQILGPDGLLVPITFHVNDELQTIDKEKFNHEITFTVNEEDQRVRFHLPNNRN